MSFKNITSFLLAFSGIFFFTFNTNAQTNTFEQRIKVAMRMVGHQMLLQAGDSTSVVLPVTKNGNRYQIALESEFQFDPSDLVRTMNETMKRMEISMDYIVEVEKCNEATVFYSYEFSNRISEDLIACGGRVLPKACYHIFMTTLDEKLPTKLANSNNFLIKNNYINYLLIGATILIIIFLIGLLRRQKSTLQTDSTTINSNKINIGKYEFDKDSLELSINNSRVELTSKEANLLITLHNSLNKTIEREQILKEVWGDEGDYVGRTLDVFISKLRKRLSADETVKIINIRGVGYKLVS